jgi:hypothetical protein
MDPPKANADKEKHQTVSRKINGTIGLLNNEVWKRLVQISRLRALMCKGCSGLSPSRSFPRHGPE